jgi:hypothetical protein
MLNALATEKEHRLQKRTVYAFPQVQENPWLLLEFNTLQYKVIDELCEFLTGRLVKYTKTVDEDITSFIIETTLNLPYRISDFFDVMGQNQTVRSPKIGQRWLTSPGLASMGFGLSGGIGMALSSPKNRTLVFEGDGGMAQNLQEFGVVRSNNLNLKIFIADNGNYGSIKAHQKSAFNNHYIGCDKETGLWLPDWERIARAFDIPALTISSNEYETPEFLNLFTQDGPAIFLVKVDPDQVIYPKIASTRSSEGLVISNPLHIMEPPLDEATMELLCPHLC